MLFTPLAFGQIVDIRLVNAQIGRPNEDVPWGTSPTTSNDAGLNAILQANGINRYEPKRGHPYPDYSMRMVEVSAAPADINQFIATLNQYSTVVEKAVISNPGIFRDAVSTKIITPGIGIPTGSSNNIITTNDPGLNQIFTNYNVFYYSQIYPNVYDVVCNCDNVLLKAALDSYTSVIEAGSTHYSYEVYLNAAEFDKTSFSIYPNPFTTTFTIESQQPIIQYSVFDITGKQLIKTAAKSEFDIQISKLNPGIFLLKLDYENGKSSNLRIIKN